MFEIGKPQKEDIGVTTTNCWFIDTYRMTFPHSLAEPLRVYLGRHIPDDISTFFGWLTYGSPLMYPYLPKRVLCHFDRLF